MHDEAGWKKPAVKSPKGHKTLLIDTLLLLSPIISIYHVTNSRVYELVQVFVCPCGTSS